MSSQHNSISPPPLVSVLMNCYNGEKFLNQAIDSVISQSYQNWELIFWDNQSEDESAEIFKKHVDSRLKYYYAPKHTLLYEARNYALEHVRGELIAFLDVDDCWLPYKLEFQVELFKNQNVGLACSNFFIENQTKGKRWVAHNNNMPQGMVLDHLLQDYYVGLLTLMVRRSILSELRTTFNNNYHIIGDFDLVIRLSSRWEMAVIHNPLAVYKIHGGNETSKHRERAVMELEAWYEEQAMHPIIASSSNFVKFSKTITYRKVVNSLLAGRRLLAFKHTLDLPLGRIKFVLFASVFLPTSFLKRFKN